MVLLLFAAILLVYSQVLRSPFVLDDRMYILENDEIRSLSAFWPPAGTRYIAYLSFALNFSLGGFDPFGYHLVNVIVHAINSVLVFALVSLTFRTPLMSDATGGRGGLAFYAGALSALLFALHPVQTEAVTYVTQRFASLAAFFYLLSLVTFIRWRLSASRSWKSLSIFALSVVSAVAAQKTKEISFTLPFVIVLYDFAFFNSQERLRARLLRLAPFVLAALVIPLEMLAPAAGSGIDEKIRLAQLDELLTLSRYDYLMTQFRVVSTYIRLLFLPIDQNLLYDFRLSKGFFEPMVAASFVFLAAIFFSALYLFFRSRKHRNPYGLLASAGVLWFFMALSVESSVVPIRDVIFEHRLYLPLAGASAAASGSLLFIFEYARRKGWGRARHAATLAVIVITASLGAATYARNLVWKDPLSLYQDIVGKSPGRATVHFDLGKIYRDAGRGDDAVREYRKAIELDPDYAEPHTNLGNLFISNNLADPAIQEYTAALRIDPADNIARYNLGLVLSARSRNEEAIEQFIEVIRLDPGHAEAYNSIGNIYFTARMLDKAGQAYMAALKADPGYVVGRNNLGNVHYLAGRLDMAEKEYLKAVELKPDYAEAHNNLGALYLLKGDFGRAAEESRVAVDLNPGNADSHFVLGRAYYASGKMDEAIREFKVVLRIDPFDTEAHLRVADALMAKGANDEAIGHYKEFIESSKAGSLDKTRASQMIARLKRLPKK